MGYVYLNLIRIQFFFHSVKQHSLCEVEVPVTLLLDFCTNIYLINPAPCRPFLSRSATHHISWDCHQRTTMNRTENGKRRVERLQMNFSFHTSVNGKQLAMYQRISTLNSRQPTS